jgi:hypothetical protein
MLIVGNGQCNSGQKIVLPGVTPMIATVQHFPILRARHS